MKRHTFSIRIPEDLVVEVSRLAQERKTDRNAVMNEMLRFGLRRTADFEKAVRDFVFREVTKEEMLRLETGV